MHLHLPPLPRPLAPAAPLAPAPAGLLLRRVFHDSVPTRPAPFPEELKPKYTAYGGSGNTLGGTAWPAAPAGAAAAARPVAAVAAAAGAGPLGLLAWLWQLLARWVAAMLGRGPPPPPPLAVVDRAAPATKVRIQLADGRSVAPHGGGLAHPWCG